ncbi:FG-GAP-like repeat-containing protein [Vibrio sp. Of14-4]|uniref:RHS repeat-associated core domain-containing protein n=1 Tax=Vibrio sp. Of14-4 TaxID=2724878 RepID=UPI001EF22B29|nr:RHS repeat-associated core domain-containing protein [Vibrio sp. Of14-4]MCG7489999.1 FG-GAP-like repeat-containing protein [Vibrio sp. Of14-4]
MGHILYRALDKPVLAYLDNRKPGMKDKNTIRSYMPNVDGVFSLYFSDQTPVDLNGDGKQTLIYPPVMLNARSSSRRFSPILGVTDIDNDGKDDYYLIASNGRDIQFHLSSKGHRPFKIKGNGSFEIDDLNNDGYKDLVIVQKNNARHVGVRSYLFDGHRFVSHSRISNLDSRGSGSVLKVVDFDNDGYPEVNIAGDFYKNRFGRIDFSTRLGSHTLGIQQSLDYNSDGHMDFVRQDNEKVYLVSSSPYPTDKVAKIEELAVEYSVTYKVATDTSVHTQERYYQFPFANTTPTAYLVSKVTKQPKGYAPITYDYHYSGAKSHLKGGGFLGFKTITETETADVVTVTKTSYAQQPLALKGKISSLELSKNGHKVSHIDYQYKVNTRRGYNANYYQVYAQNEVRKEFSLGSDTVEKQESITRTSDSFGNLMEETKVISSELEGAGQFTSHFQFEYVSEGLNQNHYIYDITSVSNIDNLDQTLKNFKAGMTRYCGTNGEVFFSPNDHFVLIHGEVDIPIVLERYNHYFKYQTNSYNVDLDGLTIYQGQLVNSNAGEFASANVRACGSYSYKDYDGDGNMEFTTANRTRVESVGQTGNNYWKIGAIKRAISTIVDNSTDLKRTVANDYAYNASGFMISDRMSSSDYDSNGEVAQSAKFVTQHYGYDNWGNVTSESIEGTDLKRREQSTTFDSQGLFAIADTNAEGHRSRVKYDAQGRLVRTISALKNRTSEFSYDVFGRLKTETLPGKGNVNRSEYQIGGACGQYATEQTVSCVTTTLGAGGQVITLFDYAGREVRKLHTGFSGQLVVVDTKWDRNGRKLSVTRPQYAHLTEPAPKVTFGYDALNREISKQEPAAGGGIAGFTTRYQGYKTSVKDARGFTHSTITNVMGHILRKEEPDSAYQTYLYYPDGKLKSSTDSAGNTTHIRYDNLGHRRYLDDPDMGKWDYVYNAAGELIYKRDANGTVTTTEYDDLGRKTKQVEAGKVSTWRYDERGALGTLSGFAGNGSETDYYYNASGLSEEVSVKVKGEVFSTFYYYDDFERVTREVRPNGAATTLADAAKQLSSANKKDRLAVEYVYNPYGYQSAVRSPKTYADEVFTSSKFRDDIAKLLDAAKQQAAQYLAKAERYSQQTSFFSDKAAQYNAKTVNVHTLDASSLALLKDGYRYKQWCNEQGECYLRPGAWVMLHDDVTIPIDVTLEGAIYRLNTALANRTGNGTRYYNATVHPVPESEFNGQNLSSAHDYLLTDYDGNGVKDLMSNQDIYIAEADASTREELLFSADDLEKAAVVASSRYKFYTDLARELIELSEQVARLSGQYCQYANQLGGNQIDSAKRSSCQNSQQSSQADHLNLILTQSQLADSTQNKAYVYYWQRRETDAYDHTLAETLGNGLVNTYSHDANTGRPNYITTHKASVLFDPSIRQSTAKGRNIRFIQYRYDNHNNVTYRYDESLGITDTWQYDGLDRVVHNKVSLASKDRHGLNNPDFAGPFKYQYDKLGNIKYKSDIGRYEYSGRNAGPHAVTKANGLHYQYDANGNMLRASASGSAQNERELEWTAFNKPSKIVRNGKTVEFFYDANHNRYLKKNSDGIETFYFGKSYERITDSNTGITQHKHFVYADGKLIALNTQSMDANNQLKDKQIRYLHYDTLNSVDMITDGYGNVVERRSYDTWGKQRKVTWREEGPQDVVQSVITNRGYTGHEEITEVGLVHMNGRVYDQELGRFISADPLVQAPYETNSFNRYSYVWNNPLKFTDPTGFKTYEYSRHKEYSNGSGARKRKDNGKDSYIDAKDKFAPDAQKTSRKENDSNVTDTVRVKDGSWQHEEYRNGKIEPRDDSIPGRYQRVDVIQISKRVSESLATTTKPADGSIDDGFNKFVDAGQILTKTPQTKIAVEAARAGVNHSNRETYVEETVRTTTYSTTKQEALLDTKTGKLHRMGDKKDHSLKVEVRKSEGKESVDKPAGTPESEKKIL